MENVRNRMKVEFIEKYDTDKIIKQQSKLTFNGIHKSYENYNSYTFEKKNEILMDKSIYLGFALLEISKFFLYEIFFMINYNHILDRKIFNYIIWILIALC